MKVPILAAALAVVLTPAAYAAGVSLWAGGAATQVTNSFYSPSNEVLVGGLVGGPVPGAVVSSITSTASGGEVGATLRPQYAAAGLGFIQANGLSYIQGHGSIPATAFSQQLTMACACRVDVGMQVGYTMADEPVMLQLVSAGGVHPTGFSSEFRATPRVTIYTLGVRLRYSQPTWAVPSLMPSGGVATGPRVVSLSTQYSRHAVAEVGYLCATQTGAANAGFVGVESPIWRGVQVSISGVVAPGGGEVTPGPYSPQKPWRSGMAGFYSNLSYRVPNLGVVSLYYGDGNGSRWLAPATAGGNFRKVATTAREFGISYSNRF